MNGWWKWTVKALSSQVLFDFKEPRWSAIKGAGVIGPKGFAGRELHVDALKSAANKLLIYQY